MSLNDYTGTVIAVKETIYPSSSSKYYLQDVPDSISSIVAYAITDTHNTNSGEDIAIEDEEQIGNPVRISKTRTLYNPVFCFSLSANKFNLLDLGIRWRNIFSHAEKTLLFLYSVTI